MLLKIGSKGEQVKKLQEKLGAKPDGSFGPGTEKKVKAWQTANGLKADGLVGDTTWAKMFNTPTDTATPVKPVEPKPISPSTPTPSEKPIANLFKLDKLKGHIPDEVLLQIPETAAKFSITNTLRLAHLLSQCGHESGRFKLREENLNYSASRLKAIFPKRFPGGDINAAYANKPIRIGNRAYALKNGNGDEASGDGYKFRGRGFIQLTGRNNYAAFDKLVDDDIMYNPDLVSGKYALASAAFYFQTNGLWILCDKGASKAVVESVTRAVNGPAKLGLGERQELFKEYYTLLS